MDRWRRRRDLLSLGRFVLSSNGRGFGDGFPRWRPSTNRRNRRRRRDKQTANRDSIPGFAGRGGRIPESSAAKAAPKSAANDESRNPKPAAGRPSGRFRERRGKSCGKGRFRAGTHPSPKVLGAGVVDVVGIVDFVKSPECGSRYPPRIGACIQKPFLAYFPPSRRKARHDLHPQVIHSAKPAERLFVPSRSRIAHQQSCRQ